MESETSSSPDSTAVSALHRSMVILRKELEMKNKQIANLEANLQRAMTPRTVDRNFNDIFELVEVVESDTDTHQRSSPASPTKSDKGTDKHFDPGTPTEDPIMAFVLSDEEERQPAQKHSPTTPPPFRRISLKMNEDIVIHTYNSNHPHQPPSRTLSSSHLNPERPILQTSHPHLPTADSAIQTDITAVKPRQWASEPLLVKRPYLGTRHVGKVDFAGRGRYSLLNRDFTPQKSNHRLNLYPPTSANDEQKSSTFTTENSKWQVNLTLISEDAWDSEIDSTDKLLFIAEEFVSTARRKLVQIQDWKAIYGLAEWKAFFSCVKGGVGVLVKLEKIVLCFSA
ncbi:hypothetical protein TCAL_00019 [Tigriopus californicus]|uniref:Uncharacterized protein n=1 Tax=Tigriopus californicus TaxID=6832 RepID=A0A553PF99_TIGCA|nr:hypothetical protein TCAL_00019 [Tigriopus californicus]|eukprot:TCALIF_00019-PA protein Name:"Protein of unknown function" AED:0.54 eAED:0.82 QI:0/0.5/0.33/1/1/1/3/44/339